MKKTTQFLSLAVACAAGLSVSNADAQEANPVILKQAIDAATNKKAAEEAESPESSTDKTEIAKKLANPIANMISVPLQWNWDQKTGKNGQGHDQTLLVQPVIPVSLTGGDNLIFRPIVTAEMQSNVNGFSGTGMQGVQLETFYAPNTGSSLIWGVGPYLASPAGASGHFGSQQTGGGVTGVVLDRAGPWTYGLLAFNSWKLGGNAISGTQNNLYWQPFLAYVTSDAWTFSLNTQSVYNYDVHRTQNPVNAQISKLIVTNGLPISYAVAARYNVTSMPGGAQGWGARASITFVFSK
ncbi:MAG: hypothetical protein ACOYBR_07885 [Fluviibacter sp.]